MDVALTVAVTVVEFPLVWLVNNDGEYVMGMLSETSSLFDDEDWWWTEYRIYSNKRPTSN